MSSLRKIELACRHCGERTAKTVIMLTFIDRFACEACAGVTPIGRDLLPALDAIERSFKDLDQTVRELRESRTVKRWAVQASRSAT